MIRSCQKPQQAGRSVHEVAVHEVAACGVLRILHDELDRLVADAYGWPWPMETEEILSRLVALHDDRVAEERRGVVRWLRPNCQVPRFGDHVEAGDGVTHDFPAPWDHALEHLAATQWGWCSCE